MVVVAAAVTVAVAAEGDCVAPAVAVAALSPPFRSGAPLEPPSPSLSWRPACCAEAFCAAEDGCTAAVPAAGSVVTAPFLLPAHR